MIAIGIDPGRDGAIVCIDEECRVVAQMRMSTLVAEWNTVAATSLRVWFLGLARRDLVWLESLQRRPGEATKAAQTQGIGWGLMLGVLGGLAVDVQVVRPQVWRRAIGLPLSSSREEAKSGTIEWARGVRDLDLCPGRCAAPHNGLADAAGLAAGALTELVRRRRST